jgi:hypothetical protein
VYISFDTSDLSDTDRKVLALLAGNSKDTVIETATVADVKAEEPKPAPAPKPEPVKEEAAEAPEESLDEALDELATTQYTLEDAITLATKMVSEGNQAAVKAAITSVGAKRVSEMKGDQIAKFISILEG